MGVMAGTPRTAVGRVLALGGAAVGCGVLTIGLADRVRWLGAHAGTARPDDLVELGVLAAGVLVLSWLAGSAGLAAACLVARGAGHVWRGGEAWVHRCAPAIVRRALVVAVAAGLGAASVSTASAQPLPTPGPTTVAVVPAGEAAIDLGWVLTGPTPPTTGTVPAADDDDATPGEAGTSGTGDVPWGGSTAGVAPPVPSGTAVAPDATAVPSPSAAPTTSAGRTPAAHGTAPQVAPASPASARGQRATVVVVRGDTLWGIAARHLPPDAGAAQVAAAWPDWYAANAATIGPDPGLILPGQVLVVPAGVTR